MASLNFDASQVEPESKLDAIPAGWYNAMITESEMKPTTKGDGSYLQVQLKILDGQHAGRVVFDRMNLTNPNPVAAEIGYKRLSAYCHATGVIQVQDSQQLHGIPMKIKVSVRTDSSGQYEPSNEVKQVKHVNENVGGDGRSLGAPSAPAWAPPAQAAPQPYQQAPQQFQPPAQQMYQSPQPTWTPPPAQPAAPQFQAPPQQMAPAQTQGPAAQAGGSAPPWAQPAPTQPAQNAAPAQPGPAAQAGAPVPPWAQKNPAAF